MAENSGIEWTTHTFNPWRGCVKVSPACKNCYAATRSKRFGEDFARQRIVLSDAGWKDPLKWNRQAEGADVRPRVFCASLADVFEDWDGEMVNHKGQILTVRKGGWGPTFNNDDYSRLRMNDVRRRLFELIDATPKLDWLLLTKRPENIRRFWPQSVDRNQYQRPGVMVKLKIDNVWLGTTVENQEQADKRVPELLKHRGLASNLFLSCEPLLGPVSLTTECPIPADEDGPERIGYMAGPDDGKSGLSVTRGDALSKGIDWVIAGGESGPNARPSHPDWFRSLRDQCKAVPFHFKQWGEWAPGSGNGFTQWPEIDKNRPLLMPSDLGSSKEDHHEIMIHIGKKKAGRLLDGVEHNGFPNNDTLRRID